jgi:NAD(P)-dependent dehydrogenase (short-subunit alcohol dehydrogenase family)
MLSGKTVVITGANSGIGKESARALGKLGAKVILVCRNEEKGKAALSELKTAGNFELVIADLSSLKSVETLAQTLLERCPKIDVLLHNAGVFYKSLSHSKENIEMTLAVNHGSVFHLTNLLLPRLKASAPSRIVIVSSALHKKGKGHFERKSGYNGMKAYNESKLLNLLFMKELVKKLEGTGVTINCVHPGVVATNIANNSGLLYKLGAKLISPFILTPEQGARTSVKVASDPALSNVTGKYFEKETIARHNPLADDEKLARSAWEMTERLIAGASSTQSVPGQA